MSGNRGALVGRVVVEHDVGLPAKTLFSTALERQINSRWAPCMLTGAVGMTTTSVRPA